MHPEKLPLNHEDQIEIQGLFYIGYIGYRTKKEIDDLENDMEHLPKEIQKILMGIVLCGMVAPVPGASLVTPLSLSIIFYFKREKITDWVNAQIIRIQNH